MTNDGALRIAVIGTGVAGNDVGRLRALADAAASRRLNILFLDGEQAGEPDAALAFGPVSGPHAGVAARASERVASAGAPLIAVGEWTGPAVMRLPGGTPLDVLVAVGAGLAGHHRRLAGELSFAEQCQLQAARQIEELHDEMVLAAGIQKEFLPRESAPSHGLELSVLLRPSSFVSGDIYRVERVDDRRVALLLADAVGHGFAAGLLTMLMGSQFTLATRAGVSCPGKILASLNNALLACGGRPKLATAACAVFDEVNGELTAASAGHPMPVLVTANGGVCLSSQGVLMGVCEDVEYATETVTMRPGDTFVAYTDGLEVLCTQHVVGNAGGELRDWLATVFERGCCMQKAAAAAETKLDGCAGSLRYPDDITIVAARFMGCPADRRAAA